MPMCGPMSVLRQTIGRAVKRARREDGVTLIELITVMVILGIVLAGLVGSFTSAMRQEVDQTSREVAYSNARLALDRMRVDIHCAGNTLPQVDQNPYGGFTMTLTESHEGQPGWCQTVVPAGDTSSGVQWCTVPYLSSTTRFVLYRYIGLNASDCGAGGSGSSFEVDYVAIPPGGWPTNTDASPVPTNWIGNLWPTSTACPSASLPTVSVDVNVAQDPVVSPKQNYELKDEIAVRNANRC